MQDTVPNTVTKAPSPCHTALPSPGDKCHGLGIPTYISVNMHVVIGVSASKVVMQSLFVLRPFQTLSVIV